jgi:hypothetical protein
MPVDIFADRDISWEELAEEWLSAGVVRSIPTD